MTATYVVGDIHGQKAELDRALELIMADGGAEAAIVFVGDYADRGADTRGVIETLIAGISRHGWTVLKGNHDAMFVRFLQNMAIADAHIKSGKTWLHPSLGGASTLNSYFEIQPIFDQMGVDLLSSADIGHDPALDPLLNALHQAARKAVPKAHETFLDGLPLIHETETHFFVHAGVNPKLPLNMQDPEELMWIRDGWLDHTAPLRKMIVHGHTALDHPAHHGNRINTDGGAGYGRTLVPVVLDGTEVFTLTEQGRVPLTIESRSA